MTTHKPMTEADIARLLEAAVDVGHDGSIDQREIGRWWAALPEPEPTAREPIFDQEHPGEPHRFGTSCIDGGEFGRIVLSIVGPNERVDITPYVPLNGSECRGLPDDEWRCAVHEGGWASGRLRGRGRCSKAPVATDADGLPDFGEGPGRR